MNNQKIFKTIEVRYDKNGHIYCNAHDGWVVTDYPQECSQCQTFSRDNYRIKVAVYGTPLEHLETFGAYLAAGLIDGYKNPIVWRNVDLDDWS